MSSITIENPGSTVTSDPLPDLQQSLLRAVTTGDSKAAAIASIAAAVAETTHPDTMVYAARDASQSWSEPTLLSPGPLPAAVKTELQGWCDDACRHGTVQINAIEEPAGGLAVTVPILLKGAAPDAFVTIYHGATHAVDRLVAVHQLVAAHVALWHVLQDAKRTEFEAETTASLMELLSKLETTEDFRESCCHLVNELREYLGCQRIALGLCPPGRKSCRLYALSGTRQLEERGELVRLMEAALGETIMRDCLTVWPAKDDAQRQAGLGHERLRTATAASRIVSTPLRDEKNELVGAWMFLGDAAFGECDANIHFIEAAAGPIGSRLRLLQRSTRGRLARAAARVLGGARTSQRRLILTAAAGLLSVLCLPMPHKMRCDCTLEPVVRRFVVAPYEGILLRSHVEAGDLVARHQVLATMDRREIELELAGLEADYNRALKERDSTLAEREIAASQRARLKMKRLGLQRELLQNRLQNLEIKSPLDGIVLSGDLEHVQGAPLAVGESLLEIAPLDKLLVEVSVSQSDINHVEDGATVEVRLEAYPWRKWESRIKKIWPRSVIRDDENVFVAEVELANDDLQLRPGMKGRAKITGERRPLAWNLFHKPVESFLLVMGW